MCWGLSDFLAGIQARRVSLAGVMFVSRAIGFCAVAAVLAVTAPAAPAVTKLIPAVLGGVAGLAGLAAFYRALAIGTMSIVAPIAATGVIVPEIVGLARGDRPKALQLAGILVATAGVILASRHQAESPPARRAAQASLGLALLAALGFGAFFVGLSISARSGVLWSLIAARVPDLVVVGALAAWAGRGLARAVRGRALLALVVVGLLDPLANGLYALATRHGLLSVVAVLASLYPLATILLARILLGERVRRVQELGIAAALTGVALIAAG